MFWTSILLECQTWIFWKVLMWMLQEPRYMVVVLLLQIFHSTTIPGNLLMRTSWVQDVEVMMGYRKRAFDPLMVKFRPRFDPNGPLMLILIGSLLGSPINKGCIHHQATKLAINLPLLVSHYRPLAHSPLRFIDPARSSVKWGQIEYLVASLVCLSNTTWSRAPEIWCHS